MKRTGKILIRMLYGITVTIALAVAGIYISGNGYIFNAFRKTILKGYSTAHIDDYVDFKNAVIRAGAPQPWKLHEQFDQFQLTAHLRAELENFHTIGLVVVKDGKLLYEEYWDNYSENSLTNSFSMAKSITVMLLEKAIEQGYIKGLEQKITDFIPEFLRDSLGSLATVGDLSSMRSGFDWQEEYYTPFNMTTKAYYGNSIERQLLKRHFSDRPGGRFQYSSADTQLLAIVLKRATGKSLAQYLSETFWQPMGMESDALWSLSGPIEKSFCCIHSNVRDFAKIGQLLLQKGNWNGVQLLDSTFVEKMITPCYDAFDPDEPKKYGHSIWIDESYDPVIYGLMGHLGQRVVVVPEEQLVIVRLGKNRNTGLPSKGPLDADVYFLVDEIINIIKSSSIYCLNL
jgi:CubicO group peptidase (beta-lactamase class C family)